MENTEYNFFNPKPFSIVLGHFYHSYTVLSIKTQSYNYRDLNTEYEELQSKLEDEGHYQKYREWRNSLSKYKNKFWFDITWACIHAHTIHFDLTHFKFPLDDKYYTHREYKFVCSNQELLDKCIFYRDCEQVEHDPHSHPEAPNQLSLYNDEYNMSFAEYVESKSILPF